MIISNLIGHSSTSGRPTWARQNGIAPRGVSRALARYEELIRKNPARWFSYDRGLCQAELDVGQAYLKTEKGEQAAKWFERALATHDAMIQKHPEMLDSSYGFWQALFDVGQAYLKAGKGKDAAEWFERAHTRQEAANQKNPKDLRRPLPLCRALFDAGEAFKQAKQWERAAEWYERALKALEAHHGKILSNSFLKAQQEKELIWRRWWAHHHRALALTELKRVPEASKERAAAEELMSHEGRRHVLLEWACGLARSGDHGSTVTTTDAVLAWPKPTAGILYDAACAYALASAVVKNDDALRARYADRAVATLKKSITAGWKNAGHLRRDTDLDFVRGRTDFKKLVAELEKKK
jgi:tetratricopeptide (TPR) repeat protein